MNRCKQQIGFERLFAELRDENYDVRHWEEHASRIPMLVVTDCKSLHDHLNKDGGPPPSEKRLAMDMQVLKDMVSGRNVEIRWVNTRQMVADCLTKEMDPLYLYRVLEEQFWSLTEDTDLSRKLLADRLSRRRARQAMSAKRHAVTPKNKYVAPKVVTDGKLRELHVRKEKEVRFQEEAEQVR